jgi:hypothetical protein
MSDQDTKTNSGPAQFDFSAHPPDALFHDRREGRDRRDVEGSGAAEPAAPAAGVPRAERRQKKDRRRRIDPTTFDKQYTDDEMEFMNAMQRFKECSGKNFPSHGEVITVAVALGYRQVIDEPASSEDDETGDDLYQVEATTSHAVG